MPTRKPPPFVHHDGRWFMNPTWERRPAAAVLREALKELLERHRPDDILLLRPLTRAEAKLLAKGRDDCDAELLARMVAPDEIRRERKAVRRRS